MTKTIYKPWGKEVWLELNDKYCYKRIYINAGNKTSYQYHHHKLETNYLIEGTAEVWLENDDGVVDKKIMNPGDFFTIEPPKKHRVIAITDIILQEVSTPEVNDVVRIEDDSNRSDGKIEHEHARPALCILTAGLGKRMGGLCSHINKGLLPLDNKALISHLVDKTSKDYEIVVALGYKGEMVKEYCEAAHPDRKFIFVNVDNYEGPGSGPAYSISQCKEHLQRPFVWAVADTIITNPLPPLETDWLGLYPTDIPELYSTADVEDDVIVNFKDKSKDGYNYAFIGIAGVYDYSTFWKEINVSSGEIVSAYYNINNYSHIKAKYFDWYDAGTIDNYLKAQKGVGKAKQYSIPKTNGEFLYKIDNTFIKLSSNKNFIAGRIARAKPLEGLCPPLSYKGNNVYSYQWITGKTLYECNDPKIWKDFLSFAQAHMWNKEPHSMHEPCIKFYKDKTHDRLKLFLSRRDSSYQEAHTINGVKTPPIKKLLKVLEKEDLYTGIPTKLFHGDLQFDNIVYGDDKNFYLIDWREDFGGGEIGDVCYDLAKMYGGILMSYSHMREEENFSCTRSGQEVFFKYSTEPSLEGFVNFYENWLKSNNFNVSKIKTLTALIFLNMAPLHEKEFGDLLFFQSKLMLSSIE